MLIKSKPESAEERIVKYSEFAAQFGNDNNLDMEGRNLNFIQFYCLDIVLPVFLILIFGLFILLKAVLKFVKYVDFKYKKE